jgi:drug/metabolite transporter (DMT)-like permease
MAPTSSPRHPRWFIIFLLIDFLGLFLFLLGLQPGLFGLDRSPVMGYLQVIVFLIGLGLVAISTYSIESLMRPVGQPITTREDIGIRLSATGYVLFAVSSTSDLIGLGSHPLPGAPFIGVLQSIGILIGTGVTILGLAMYHPRKVKILTPVAKTPVNPPGITP